MMTDTPFLVLLSFESKGWENQDIVRMTKSRQGNMTLAQWYFLETTSQE